ncbi:hypothetical protein [Nocardia sp. bgisy118]|uniref:hypothetical protein n=1 Tax=Nocardia sp. bgisy118 TaxID=3413786 RepID=UPI003F4A32C3
MSDNDVDSGAASVAGDNTAKAADETAADVKAAAAQSDAKPAASLDMSAVAAAKPAASEGEVKAVVSTDAKPAVADGEVKAADSTAAGATVDAKPAAAETSWRDRLRIPGGANGVVAARAAVAVLLGAAVASTGWFFVQNRNNEALLEAHEEAKAAACAYAPVLANYDAKNLDAYFAAVLDGATGDWKKQFDDTSRELKEVLTQGEVVSKTNDVQCAVKSGDETSAEAIVVIGQTITSVGTQGKPAPGQLSMVMRMAKVDGKWLVNKVNSPLVPSPQQ